MQNAYRGLFAAGDCRYGKTLWVHLCGWPTEAWYTLYRVTCKVCDTEISNPFETECKQCFLTDPANRGKVYRDWGWARGRGGYGGATIEQYLNLRKALKD
jgi:hypothetical protein